MGGEGDDEEKRRFRLNGHSVAHVPFSEVQKDPAYMLVCSVPPQYQHKGPRGAAAQPSKLAPVLAPAEDSAATAEATLEAGAGKAVEVVKAA